MSKALKVILIIVAVIVAAILIIPLFTPANAEVTAEIEVALEPSRIFPVLASFENREAWDPWVAADSTTVVTTDPKPGYVGSTYHWSGVRLGTGKMEVVEVTENEHIEVTLWFRDADTPSRVTWDLEPVEGGSRLVWSFTQKTRYPMERLGMMFGKSFLKQSFEYSLGRLKEFLESNPPAATGLEEIKVVTRQSFSAMVAPGGATMANIGQELGRIYGMVYEEVEKQQLQIAGPGFVHYLDLDEETGYSSFLAGFPVLTAGKSVGTVVPKMYPPMEVVQGLHRGPYEEFTSSYDAMETYVKEKGLEVTGEGMEFYSVNEMTEPDPARWETLIMFPLL